MESKAVTSVKRAISFFREGNYLEAKKYYLEAAEMYGEHLFINNVKICDLRIGQQQGVLQSLSKIHIDDNGIILNKNSCYHFADFKINSPKDILNLNIKCEINTNNSKYKIIVMFDFLNKNNEILSEVAGIGISKVFNKHFRYFIDESIVDNSVSNKVLKCHFPSEVIACSVYLGAVGLGEEEVRIALTGEFSPYPAQGKTTEISALQQSSLVIPAIQQPTTNNIIPIDRTTIEPRFTKELVVASILDEFTHECLRHEVNLVPLTKNNWMEEICSHKIDFLLVESCWRGNDGDWGTLTKGSGGGGKLGGILKYCKSQNIPTVFWNKEDPPHYEKFSPVARMFDCVITTDINMIPHYKRDHGVTAHALSFAAQPKIHHPNTKVVRLNKAVFAGSYYGDKPKRCSDFNQLMAQLKLANINYDIYDRNFERDIDKFKFPKQYQENILGCLPASEVWRLHQGYKYQVNMNTVQDSRTMFARRVYESLASGTPVISNDSLGVREVFGDLVLFSDNRKTLVRRLLELQSSPEKYDLLAKEGVRRVMRGHTYAHRIQEICQLLNIDVSIEQPLAVMAIEVNNEHEIEQALNIFQKQTATNKHLFIEMHNFENAYNYLNKSSKSVSYSMGLSKDLYTDLSKLYGSDIVLNVDVNKNIKEEALEDYSYWGL